MSKYPLLTPLPSHYRYAIVFDVETTGLLPRINPITQMYPPLEHYPHIIQMSWILFDMLNNCIVDTQDSLVQLPEDIVISPFVSELTGITNDMCKARGKPIVDILRKFYDAIQMSHVAVAHNLNFDRTMVRTEIKRHLSELPENENWHRLLKDDYNEEIGIDTYCTMMATIQVCNIVGSYYPYAKSGWDPREMNGSTTSTAPPRIQSRSYVKFPKLSELHQHLFGYVPENLHNAIVDVLVCLRCFLKIRCCNSIPDSKFISWTRKILKPPIQPIQEAPTQKKRKAVSSHST